jgi:hypothetical protein
VSFTKWFKQKKEYTWRNLNWLARLGDDIYAIQSLIRWAHPRKTVALCLGLSLASIIVSLFPFHRVLFVMVVFGFAEGFYAKYKWVWLTWYFKGGRPTKVEVEILGTKLKCSRKSGLLRVRNLLNSLPNDRDYEDHFAPQRRVVAARAEFLQHCYTGVRYGGIWSGPLSFKWKVKEWKKTLRPSAFALNVQALADLGYKKRFCVISPGFLRMFAGPRGHEDAHSAAEGYDELVLCKGWVACRGACLTLDISHSTAQASMTTRGVPSILINECPQKQCASWKISLSCVNHLVRSTVLKALGAAGCTLILETRSNLRA